jgi:membrane protein YqaA with SNARE-associated domain
MTIPDLIEQFGPYFATFIFSIFSALIPFVNLEFYLVVVSAIAPDSWSFLTIILFIATSGHMIAKGILYGTGRGVLNFSLNNDKYGIKQIRELHLKMEKMEGKTNAFLFFSGVTGLPPFYLVAILAGTLRINFWNFFVFGFLGRAIRLAIVLALPQLLKESL